MANFASIIANRGYYISPHLIKGVGNNNKPLEKYTKKNWTSIDSNYFKFVIAGMEQVVLAGTAYWTRIEGISICGKTGTVQNPHGDDHSVFIAFAPKDNPKIAIAVFVENAGFGAMTAAPIANLMIEKYLTGKISREPMQQYILSKNLLPKELVAH
jgi:penicillin-binding protein 2